MPGVLLGIAGLSASVFGGGSLVTQGLVGAVGPFIVDRFSTVVRHDWPIAAANRKDFFDRAFANTGPEAAPLRDFLEAAATKSREELEAERAASGAPDVIDGLPDDARGHVAEMERHRPGLWNELSGRGGYIRRATGSCLTPLYGRDFACVLDPAAPISKGDTVFFALRGGLAVLGKIYAGSSDGSSFFWMGAPDALISVSDDNLLHADKVVLIQPRDGAPYEPQSVEFPGLATEDVPPPKVSSLADAHDAALISIWAAARDLPD